MKYALALLFFVAVAAAFTDVSERRFRREIDDRARQLVLKVLKAEFHAADRVLGALEKTADVASQREPLVGDKIRQVVQEARTSLNNVDALLEKALANPDTSVLGVAEQVRLEIKRLLAQAEEDVKNILGGGY